jgi:hypothetical protein
MRLARLRFLNLLCLPFDLLGLAILGALSLSCRLTCGDWGVWADTLWFPPLDSWVARRWPYSTTLGRWLLIHPLADAVPTIRHEARHIRQSRLVGPLWAALALVTWSPALVALWPVAWLLVYGAACAAAWLGGGQAYRDNVFEQHARHQ